MVTVAVAVAVAGVTVIPSTVAGVTTIAAIIVVPVISMAVIPVAIAEPKVRPYYDSRRVVVVIRSWRSIVIIIHRRSINGRGCNDGWKRRQWQGEAEVEANPGLGHGSRAD